MPDRASVPVKLTVTFVLFQPLAFGTGKALAEIVGGVLSMLRVKGVTLMLPALSVHVPPADWPAPSLLSVAALVHVSMPDSASVPVKLTVTSVLFQP